MNRSYLFFILLFLSNIKIIIPSYNEYNFNSDFDEDNNEDHILKSNIKNLFLYGSYLSEFLMSQSPNKEDSSQDLAKIYEVFRNELENILGNVKENITPACYEHLYTNLIGYDDDKNISKYHIKKLIDDSSKHRNDLGTYDQCMNKRYKLPAQNYSNTSSISTYVVFVLDRTYEINETTNKYKYNKSSTDFEQVFFIRGFCLPQSDNDICSTDDYRNFITGINEDLGDLLGINITNISTFMIKDGDKQFGKTKTSKENFIYILSLVPFFLCLIQVCLIICRELIISCCLNKCCGYNIKTEKEDIFLNNNNEENDEDDENDENDNENKKILNKKKIHVPKWINIYNKCFNFSENFKELFNFKLNSTSINNDSGLTYIRGLKATSLFILVAGLTFLTLMNSLSIIFSKTLFLEFLKEWFFYPIFFIGLRYAPGFIFSCSGYTLAYKFLSYIDKNFSFLSIIKFIFYQSHKYIILIGYSLFQRFSLYILFSMYKNTPMWKFLNEMILSRPDNSKYFISLLGLSYFSIGDKRYDQTIVDYFWIPFNEIVFFVHGILIISIGYKFKLRIDYFILFLILFIYIFNILFTYLTKTDKGEKYFPTLYYYLFDYGKYMTTPQFNFPSYLIGMYFGFINYCVQKGIISITVSDLFNNTTKSSTNKINEEEMDLSINNNNNNNKSMDEEEEDDEDDDDKDNNKITKQKFDTNDKSNYRNEIIEMPFLIAGVKISNWLRNHRVRLLSLIMLVSVFFALIIHFIVLKINISDQIDAANEKRINGDQSQCGKINSLLTLTDYITDDLINFIFRIDIVIIVFLYHSLLFICYFKGKNFINNFFCHIFWAMFNKSYFSYILVANPVILFILYQSETKIILNLYNLILYSLISGTVIFICASFSYIFFELPYKKLIKIIFSNDLENNELEEKEEEEEENKSEEDEDD